MTKAVTKASARVAFEQSRGMEYFEPKQFAIQVGGDRSHWAILILKELIDNALDACEEEGIPPVVSVAVETDTLTVRDNGPGLPPHVLERSLDYSTRISTKLFYVSPTRGQLGNALKCVWAAPFVATGGGHVEVLTRGRRYTVRVTVDQISQTPHLNWLYDEAAADVKTGTVFRIHWPGVASYLSVARAVDFYTARRLLWAYAVLNSAATFELKDRYGTARFLPAAASSRRWLPSADGSAHWYRPDDFVQRIRGHIAAERAAAERGERGQPLTVRQFVESFHDLKSRGKQQDVIESVGLTGAKLNDLVIGDDVDREPAEGLLAAMKEATKEVDPDKLGGVGKKWLTDQLTSRKIDPGSIKCVTAKGVDDGVPFVLEVAFGVRQDGCECREVYFGVNFAPVIASEVPDELSNALGEARVEDEDPVVLVVHLACPRVTVLNRAKDRIQFSAGVRKQIGLAVEKVTKDWVKIKRKNDRSERNIYEEIRRHKRQPRGVIVEAAYAVMHEAYLKASANGTLPANARQVMYAARPLILERTGGTKIWKNDSYFTQILLPDFMEENPEVTADWDVVFDARGHLLEPHTGVRLGLGTIEVRNYVNRWAEAIGEQASISLPVLCPTSGPLARYRYVLFVEKEGFAPLIAKARLAERYDLAVMSSKGMTTTASRLLIDHLSRRGVRVFVLHDFDKAGFAIAHTMRESNRRYTYEERPLVEDVGLRLVDAQAMGLQSETNEYESSVDPREYLKGCGTTEAERNFLVTGHNGKKWVGERIELNAMTSDQFIAYVERKLGEHGVERVIPDEPTLAAAFRRAVKLAEVQRAINEIMSRNDQPVVPSDLAEQVRQAVGAKAVSWDQAVWQIAGA